MAVDTFIDLADYPFTGDLEAAYPVIRREMESLPLGRFKEWYEKDLYTNLWLVYGLYAMGNKLKENCAACPETVKVLERIPGLKTAGFSCLLPGTHIKPHEGFTKMVLRCHLGLSVPQPESCVLKVNGVEGHWREGKCLIFDDTQTHEAWNRGDKPRIVLLLDFLDTKKRLPFSKKLEFALVSGVVGLVSPLVYGSKKEK
ncbi:MAG TPA: aspartyl/asparaginyl beta-hydroxylase domain-containing protein [Candidatus Eisenbacteria bacterium]|jgi:beta-hydroxylase|nr:aspartyl/asparaginyl beta-hydroxylase domain-containing protein [Candidatus Eisenbacteria bacterium]